MDIIIKARFKDFMKLEHIMDETKKRKSGDKNNKRKSLIITIIDESNNYTVTKKMPKYIIEDLKDSHIITEERENVYIFNIEE